MKQRLGKYLRFILLTFVGSVAVMAVLSLASSIVLGMLGVILFGVLLGGFPVVLLSVIVPPTFAWLLVLLVLTRNRMRNLTEHLLIAL